MKIYLKLHSRTKIAFKVNKKISPARGLLFYLCVCEVHVKQKITKQRLYI